MEYRLEPGSGEPVCVLHGGHTRAGLAIGEEAFAELGFRVLAPSRPGYGRTPLSTGTTPAGFADVLGQLCRHLKIDRLAAVVGISGGGPTAVTVAARHPRLVRRLILLSAVGYLPFPDRLTRLGAQVLFRPGIEGLTWAAMRLLLRTAPDLALRMQLGALSRRPARELLATLSDRDRAHMVELFSRMRSGAGFLADLRPSPDLTAEVTQPTLVVASRADAGVPYRHGQSLAAAIDRAELLESHAASHLFWLDPDYPRITAKIKDFLAAG